MASRYQILSEISQGGVGVVLKAWDTKLSRHVAIKRFRQEAGPEEGDLLREASALCAMQHPNIVSLYDVNLEAPEGPEVIMEYLNGQDLEKAVSHAALTLEDFYEVARQTLDALGNAHRMNLLHRDIKPSNIQVTWLPDGKFVAKFVDFGLARFFEKPSKQTVRQDGTVMGSIHYMAPEQLERKVLDGRSDLYALGCVFYFALTMRRPFEGATVMDVMKGHLYGQAVAMKEFRPGIPPDVERWVAWLMNREAAERPADAETALHALRQIMAGETPAAMPGAGFPAQASQPPPVPRRGFRVPAAFARKIARRAATALPAGPSRSAVASPGRPRPQNQPGSGTGTDTRPALSPSSLPVARPRPAGAGQSWLSAAAVLVLTGSVWLLFHRKTPAPAASAPPVSAPPATATGHHLLPPVPPDPVLPESLPATGAVTARQGTAPSRD